MQTINSVKLFSTAEVASLLGCDDGYIRKLKSEHSEELEGLWSKDGVATVWTESGIKKLAEWVKTSQAIALRNNKIAQTETKVKIHETEIKTEPVSNPLDRYADLPNVLGEAIANKLIDDGILRRTDSEIIKRLTSEMVSRKPDLEGSVKDIFALLDAIAS
jgi:hypothetical protein